MSKKISTMTTKNVPSKDDVLPIVSNGANMKASINSLVGASDYIKYLTTYVRTLDARSQGVGGPQPWGPVIMIQDDNGFTHLRQQIGSNQSYSGSGTIKLSAFNPAMVNNTIDLALANASNVSYDAKALLYFIASESTTLTLKIKSFVEGGSESYSPEVEINLTTGMNEVIFHLTDVPTISEPGQTLSFQLEYSCNSEIATPAGEVGVLFIYNIWDSLEPMPEREDKMFFPFGDGSLEGVIV